MILVAVAPWLMTGQGKMGPEKTANDRGLVRVMGSPTYAVLNINNLASWMRHDGESNHSPLGDDGMTYPRGTGSVIYEDGLVWGGKMFRDAALTRPDSYQTVRFGGSYYRPGTKAGRITGMGGSAEPANPLAPDVRIYRIRRDYATLSEQDLRQDAAEVNEVGQTSVTPAEINAVRAQYDSDWKAWPVDLGAPFVDRNGNGVFDPPPSFNTDPAVGPMFTADSLIAQMLDEPGVADPQGRSPADQVIWTVFNDLDSATTKSIAGSSPIGLEVQKTMWGYRNNDALESAYFVRFRLINKGGVDTSAANGMQKGSFWIDSLYVGQWSDPDVGDAGDDIVGCDVERSMGFAYNANSYDLEFRSFGLPPPAVGYDLLAGPMVPSPGDSAIVDLRRRDGFRNLAMSAFSVALPSSGDPPSPEDYEFHTGRWWKMLRGFAPQGTLRTEDVPYPSGPYPPSPFRHSGDPLTPPGDIDGLGTTWSFPPGDRRILVSSGPARLAPGDTQEVTIAVVAGLGADRLSSIAMLRVNDRFVQSAFNRLVDVPRPPAVPKVMVTALDRSIVLQWGSDPAAVRATEDRIVAGTFEFEGYVVYQLPTATADLKDGVRVATFDRVNGVTTIFSPGLDEATGVVMERPIQFGTDAGICRSITIMEDLINGPSYGDFRPPIPLANGRKCHFAVVAYNVNSVPGELPASLSSEPVRVSVTSAIPFGLRPAHAAGDTLPVAHRTGSASTTILPIIVDPLAGMGDTLQVRFSGSGPSWRWSIVQASTGERLAAGETNRSGDGRYPIVQGVLVKVVHDSTVGAPADSTDVYEFFAAAPQQGRAVELSSADRIGVFPNPYYADASETVGGTVNHRPFVTFNNLPQRATIRIFDLAGQLVRTLQKDSPSQFVEWDLQNEHRWMVASGMYLCHVELPDLGVAKVLKAAIITAVEGVR